MNLKESEHIAETIFCSCILFCFKLLEEVSRCQNTFFQRKLKLLKTYYMFINGSVR